MVDKVTIFNIALDALLINYQTPDPDTDVRKEVRSLRTMYPLALSKVLADLDLNRTASKVKLELIADTHHPHWDYCYKYPNNCALFRRIVSPFPVDNEETRIPYATENVKGMSAVCTNKPEAWGEIVRSDVGLSSLGPNAATAVGYYLAFLASALITGKGARDLKRLIIEEYKYFAAEAQEDDSVENVDTTPDEFKSKFVQARMGGRGWRTKI